MPAFLDRHEAGRRLARRLEPVPPGSRVVVLGLPRGGVPVAFEVAVALGAPLDVVVVRKLGVPGHEEVAMGAIASGGVQLIDRDLIGRLGIDEAAVREAVTREAAELERRVDAYRGGRPMPSLADATVVVVDDGAATGASMLAALTAIREFEPRRLIAAAPVMSRAAADLLGTVADACAYLLLPEPFLAVGSHYVDFRQTTDAEVRTLLEVAARRPVGRHAGGRNAALA